MGNRPILALIVAVVGLTAARPGQATTFLVNGGLDINVPPTQTFSLGRQVTEGGDFTDLYEFTLGSPLSLTSSGFQSTRLGAASNLDFLSASLYSGYGTSGSLVTNFMHGAEDSNGQETESLGATLLGPGKYTIALLGRVTADAPVYNGNLTFAAGAVPEPATWATMMLGFAGIGLALRSTRQRKPALD